MSTIEHSQLLFGPDLTALKHQIVALLAADGVTVPVGAIPHSVVGTGTRTRGTYFYVRTATHCYVLGTLDHTVLEDRQEIEYCGFEWLIVERASGKQTTGASVNDYYHSTVKRWAWHAAKKEAEAAGIAEFDAIWEAYMAAGDAKRDVLAAMIA